MDSAETGTTRPYESLSEIVKDMTEARTYAGLHYRDSMRDGTKLGRQAAHYVLSTCFRPVGQ
jgi:hypothetical protein